MDRRFVIRMVQIRIELHDIVSSQQIHERLASIFSFPDCYGQNWDAFNDCFDEYGPETGTITIKDWDSLNKRLPRDAHLLRSCLINSENGRDNLHIVWA